MRPAQPPPERPASFGDDFGLRLSKRTIRWAFGVVLDPVGGAATSSDVISFGQFEAAADRPVG